MNASPRRTIALRLEPERERSILIGIAIAGSVPRPAGARRRSRVRNQRELAAAAQKAQTTLRRRCRSSGPQPASEADLITGRHHPGHSGRDHLRAYQRVPQQAARGHRRPRDGGPAPGGDRSRPRSTSNCRQAQADLHAVREEPGSAEGQSRPRAGDDGALPGGRRGRRGRQAGARSERLRAIARRQAAVAAAEANVESNKANVQRLARADVVPARPRALRRHGDPAQRGRGRLDHGGQPCQQHRRGAVQRDRRARTGYSRLRRSTRSACSSTFPRPTRRT